MTETGFMPENRTAGVAIHIASLPGRFGIGEIGDGVIPFIEALRKMHIGIWQFLPTGPTAYGDSPYQPLSAFAGNEMLISIESLLRRGLLETGEISELERLPQGAVDYGRLIPLKTALLEHAADRFKSRAGKTMMARYEEFLHHEDRGWLNDYALFRILKSAHGERPWTEWDRAYVYREPAALEGARDRYREGIERIKITQFLFHQQWAHLRAAARENRVRLFADMPIYIALDSADAWAHPEILRIDREGQPSHVAGVPPDYFSEDGQLWGNPLYDWDYHAANGYRWWSDRLRHAAGMADLVRIDHFRGFEAYWAVPMGEATARNGAWEPGPGDGLFDAMKADLGNLPIVAEDLGLITPEVDALRHRHDIPGMKVLQFDVCDPAFSLESIEEHCVCYTGTHDNDTTAGWFRGGNGDTRTEDEVLATRERALAVTGGSSSTIHTDMIRLAFSSRAKIAIAPMQDFLGLGSEARLNIPGTTLDNWRWRLQTNQLTPEFIASVRELARQSDRG